jgi:hypothetical protein
MENNRNSDKIFTFHNRTAPEPGTLVGYGALITKLPQGGYSGKPARAPKKIVL